MKKNKLIALGVLGAAMALPGIGYVSPHSFIDDLVIWSTDVKNGAESGIVYVGQHFNNNSSLPKEVREISFSPDDANRLGRKVELSKGINRIEHKSDTTGDKVCWWLFTTISIIVPVTLIYLYFSRRKKKVLFKKVATH